MKLRHFSSTLGSFLIMMAAPDAAADEKAKAQMFKYETAEHSLDGTSFECFHH